MRKSFLHILLLIGIVAPAQAYVTYHPTDAAAVLLSAFTVNASVGGSQSHIEVEVWSLSGGGIDYVLDVESLTFSSGCGNIGSLTLQQIMEASADAAIVEGVSRGYPLCASTVFSKNVRIWSVSCAARTGTGCGTAFHACDTEAWCYRMYEVSCQGTGIPGITQKQGSSCSCSGGCEASCPAENLE